MSGWKFYFETYGCKVNQYESQSLRDAWLDIGGIESARPEEADYICINSCAITARAERDARNAVFRLRRLAPQAKIILTGCAAQFFEDFKPLKKASYSKPDLCLAHGAKEALLHGPEHALGGGAATTGKRDSQARHFKRARAIVKVQDGCKQNCTYCIVPRIRTKLYSESPEKILAQCRQLAANGHAELMISGINLRLYGKDSPEFGDFWDLLSWLDRKLAEDYEGSLRLRISSIEPAQLGEKALRVLGEGRLICPHLHLSLQHASPKILRDMGRGHYKADDILDFTEKLARYWPLFALGADLLVGFPGEDETDLDSLLAFIRILPLSYAHVFPYSARPGTVAAARPDQIAQRIRRERAELVRAAVKEKQAAFWKKISSLGEMTMAPELVPDHKTGLRRGVNEFYVPCFMEDREPCSGLERVKALKVIGGGILVERIVP